MAIQKNKYVSFHANRTELFLTFLNEEVDFILRLNKGIKIKKKVKPLDMQLICSIKSFDLKKQKERLYLKNARHAFLFSKILYQKNEFRDAFLYLHLSLEHLIKYIWIKSRYAYQNKYFDDIPNPLDKDGNGLEYSHDLSFTIQELIRVISDFPSKTRIQNIFSPLAKSKSHGDWADIRYSTNPNDLLIQQDFKLYYSDLRPAVIQLCVDLNRNGALK